MKWSTLAHKLHQTIKIQELWKKKDSLILTFSSGRDSLVLAKLLLELNSYWENRLIILHINHHLRPEADETESAFAEQFANEHNIPCDIIDIYPAESHERPKIGLEAVARQQRYEQFEQIRKKYSASYILTAHHQNDQAETILYRLFSGAGIDGLKGIRFKNNTLVRPLLNITRQEINQYIEDMSLEFMEDSTNSDSRYTRNKIRNDIIPFLKKSGWDNLESSLVKSASSISKTHDILSYYLEKSLSEILNTKDDNFTISLNKLFELPKVHFSPLLKYFIQNRLQLSTHVNSETLAQLEYFIRHSQSGTQYRLQNKYLWIKDRDELVIRQSVYESYYYELEINKTYSIPEIGSLTSEIIKGKDILFERNPYSEYFEESLLKTKLSLRPWKPEDKMRPFASNHYQKLSNLLTKAKIPAHLRPNWPVLCAGEEIIWIPGVKRSDFYKLTTGKTVNICLHFRIDNLEGFTE